MKIIHLVETANSAAQLKAAFTREQWARIFLYFAGQKNLGLGGNDTAIRASLTTAFRSIGPEMDDVMTTDEWNSRAVSYGAQLPSSSGVTWPAIYNHIAPHKDAQVPEQYSAFDISRPPGSQMTGYRADIDRTEETPQQVSAWVEGAEEMNRAQAIAYFTAWVAALRTHRSEEWMQQLTQTVEGRNTRLRRLHRIQEQLVPQGEATVQKAQIDRALYSWLTSSDFDFNR